MGGYVIELYVKPAQGRASPPSNRHLGQISDASPASGRRRELPGVPTRSRSRLLRARLHVSNVTRESGPWAMRGFVQHGGFPETIHIDATPQTVMPKPVYHPWRPTGVEIGHGNKRMWIIFANVSTQHAMYRGGELEYLLVYVPATAGERTQVTVNLGKLYEWYGWERPEPGVRTIDGTEYRSRPVHVLAFAAVYPDNPQTTARVEFHEIRARGRNATDGTLLGNL